MGNKYAGDFCCIVRNVRTGVLSRDISKGWSGASRAVKSFERAQFINNVRGGIDSFEEVEWVGSSEAGDPPSFLHHPNS